MNQSLPPIAQTLASFEMVEKGRLLDIVATERQPREILKAVVDRGLISNKVMCKELSHRFGMPFFDLTVHSKEYLPLDLIDMKLVERHFAMPIYKHGKNLFVAMVDPTDKAALDEIMFYTGLEIIPLQVELHALEKLIEDAREGEADSTLEDFLGEGEVELDIADDTADSDEDADNDFDPDDAPIVKYVNKILIDAINKGASDIHIEPFEKELRIRFRIDGILHKITTQPISFAPRIVARIKIISRLDIAERRVPQDGRVKLKISKTKAFDFRVNTLPTLYGEKVVMRILDSSSANLDLNILGFTKEQLNIYKRVVSRPYGMVLITGPTGSGKTVTLYSALTMLNSPTKNISTVEDPVEILLPGITQVNINEKAHLDFADALRAFLRQDPDIIMLGEIRDLETAEIAIKASQTGHMVLSTLHTNDAPSTLTRLLNMGVPAFNVASAVHLIVAQRLIRKLCLNCKKPTSLPDKVLAEAGFGEDEIGKLELFQADEKGCASCTEGYRGRAGVFQVMPISDQIKTLIMEGCTEQDIEQTALREGVPDLRHSGLQKVRDGVTSLEEIERVTNV
ncbi:MAG: type IV-A pilus assembly ATPase PilB [Arenicella sp.]|nr:type IV-A pilus assembly ATPase PilB [Arenicella sp.]